VAVQHLLILLPLAYLMLHKSIKEAKKYGYVLLFLTIAVLLQLSLAAIGWFYRYEAYLIFGSVIILSVLVYKNREEIFFRMKGHPLASGLVVVMLGLPLLLRSGEAFWVAP
jgi:hypothetical protein